MISVGDTERFDQAEEGAGKKSKIEWPKAETSVAARSDRANAGSAPSRSA